MPSSMPRLFLARHGDSAWTESRQHTGRTDLPLNERGERNARQWDYGTFEGRRGKEIRIQQPGWLLYRDGCPGRKPPEGVVTPPRRFIARVSGLTADVLAFSSSHIIRMIAASVAASVGVFWYEHDNRDKPIIFKWNCVRLLRE